MSHQLRYEVEVRGDKTSFGNYEDLVKFIIPNNDFNDAKKTYKYFYDLVKDNLNKNNHSHVGGHELRVYKMVYVKLRAIVRVCYGSLGDNKHCIDYEYFTNINKT